MVNNSGETDSENITSLLLVDINQPIDLEWEFFVTTVGTKFQILLLTVLKENS